MRRKVSKYVGARIKRSRNDFKLQTFTAGGKGGQHQNTANTGVRIIDKVTGLAAESRDSRSQEQNRTTAFLKLSERLIEHYQREERRIAPPKDMEKRPKIRTYTIPGDVVDHRSKKHYQLKRTLDGDIDPIIQDVKRALAKNEILDLPE